MYSLQPGFSFIAYPKFVVAWPLILLSFLLPLLRGIGILSEKIMTECWIAALVFVVLGLGLDFKSLWATIIFLIGTTVSAIAMVITVTYEVPIFETIRRIVNTMEFSISSDTMLCIGFLLGVPYLLMIIVCSLNNRWVVSVGKIERQKFLFRGNMEYELSMRRNVNYVIMDMLEYILTFGGGHLKVVSPNNEVEYIGLVFFIKWVDEELDKYEKTPVSSG